MKEKMNNLSEEVIAKFLMGKCTEEELIQVNLWIKESDENARKLFRMEEIYHLGRENHASDKRKMDLAEKKLYKRLTEEERKQNKVLRIQHWMKYAAIITLILLTGTGAGYWIYNSDQSSNLVIVTASDGSVEEIQLPDGTKVWLNQSATLKYPRTFSAKERNIYLEGEAYFEVTKNRAKPFIVQSEAMRVRVLGTTFNFKCNKACTSAEATLIEGEIEVKGKMVTIGACCKGSGMIHPNMATMLGFITTDLNISKELLNKALKSVIPDTFNMISVDRDTSTNDTVLLLANGLAGNDEIVKEDEDYQTFKEALYYVNEYLAKCIASDGEGATKLLEVNVNGAKDVKQAKVVAKSVCTSPLVKTAIYGNDANWGRLLCAMGYSGEEFDPYQVDLFIESEFGNLQLVENGMATDYSEEFATKILSSEYVKANINMKIADGKATAWGCDLTYDYVKINADYRS